MGQRLIGSPGTKNTPADIGRLEDGCSIAVVAPAASHSLFAGLRAAAIFRAAHLVRFSDRNLNVQKDAEIWNRAAARAPSLAHVQAAVSICGQLSRQHWRLLFESASNSVWIALYRHPRPGDRFDPADPVFRIAILIAYAPAFLGNDAASGQHEALEPRATRQALRRPPPHTDDGFPCRKRVAASRPCCD